MFRLQGECRERAQFGRITDMSCPVIKFLKNKIQKMPEKLRAQRSWMPIFTDELDEIYELGRKCSDTPTEGKE